jgi:hypothetical protein
MPEYLDLSVPLGGSGMFIKLHRNGVLENAAPLLARSGLLRGALEKVKSEISSCNESTWLLSFTESCKCRGKDFEQQLRQRISRLRLSEATLEQQLADVRPQLASIDESLPTVAYTFTACSSTIHKRVLFGRKCDENDARRLRVIERNIELKASDLCKKLESEDVPLPEHWQSKFGQCSWKAAYLDSDYRRRIDTMFSRDKRYLRLL